VVTYILFKFIWKNLFIGQNQTKLLKDNNKTTTTKQKQQQKTALKLHKFI
jgi:hypothetical protein